MTYGILLCMSTLARLRSRMVFAAGWVLTALFNPAFSADKGFETNIAPLLAKHCVECHGTAKKKGRLDLSNRDSAFAGGKSGKVIVPGESQESLLWKMVHEDEMPEDRKPLTAAEKETIREWIDAGAKWPAEAKVSQAEIPNRTSGNSWVRRLTVPEYIETVRRSVGVNIEKEARELLPADMRADGFYNTAYNLNVDLAHVEAYARLAEIVVSRMDAPRFAGRFSSCRELSPGCLGDIVAGMGKRLLRGPLEEREIASFVEIGSKIKRDGGDFSDATRSVLEAMLQAPRFIYRIESGADGAGLTPHEFASRLSYTIWGAPPDKELVRAADANELSAVDQVKAQVKRMLNDPRAISRSTQFAYEWLDLERLNHLRPNKKRYPKWEPALAAQMREETLTFYKDLVWEQNRPLFELMNANFTYATPSLAKHYGFKSISGPTMPPVEATKADSSLVALYTFHETEGDTVHDVSGRRDALDLKIENAAATEWKKGSLKVKEATVIRTVKPPKRLFDSIRKSHEITIEAWVTPTNNEQSGPARIVTFSSGSSERNFTLGQDKMRFEFRLRTTAASANGMPSLFSSGFSASSELTHLAVTRDPAGRIKFYVNGDLKGAQDVGGDLSNWNEKFGFALANETTKDRPWLGSFHRVAIFARALSPEEVQGKFQTLSRVDLAKTPARGGLLTHGSVLTIGGDDASMVTRGLFVLQDLLWSGVDDPPPCVDTTPVPTKAGLTQRSIAESRLANQSCTGCHSKFEPFAFGLEKFDGLGAYSDKDEHGNKLRDDGTIVFPESDESISYKNSAELMGILARSERVRKGLTRKLTQFAIGRPLTSTDSEVIDRIHETAQQGGGTYGSLITAIVTSELVMRNSNNSNQ
jgi:hypothetical protein